MGGVDIYADVGRGFSSVDDDLRLSEQEGELCARSALVVGPTSQDDAIRSHDHYRLGALGDDVPSQEPKASSSSYNRASVTAKVIAATAAPVTTATSATAANAAQNPSAATEEPATKPRTFLKKGARMPRSEVPVVGSKETKTKAVHNPPARKSLRLQPRAASEPPAAVAERNASGVGNMEAPIRPSG